MSTERDKFLTEAMGECWHTKAQRTGIFYACDECGGRLLDLSGIITQDRNVFSAWKDFGKLWEWAQQREWWTEYKDTVGFSEYFVNPTRFADALYEFLKDHK